MNKHSENWFYFFYFLTLRVQVFDFAPDLDS